VQFVGSPGGLRTAMSAQRLGSGHVEGTSCNRPRRRNGDGNGNHRAEKAKRVSGKHYDNRPVRELSVGLCGSGALAVPPSLVTGTASARTGRKTCCRLLYLPSLHLQRDNAGEGMERLHRILHELRPRFSGILQTLRTRDPLRLVGVYQDCRSVSVLPDISRAHLRSYELVFNSCISMNQATHVFSSRRLQSRHPNPP
jgi:hypothetical protein